MIKNKGATHRFLLVTFSCTSVFTAFIILTRYATIDDFIFYNLVSAIDVEKTGHVDMGSDPIPGFTFLCVMTSQIVGLDYATTVYMPLLTPLFVFVLMSLLRRISPSSNGVIGVLIMSTWMLYFGMNPTYFCHTIGLGLLFILMLVALLPMDKCRAEYTKIPANHQSSIAMLIIIASINMISYKLMLMSVVFLLVLQITLYFGGAGGRRRSVTNPGGYMVVFIVGTVIALAFNWFFYESFVPAIRNSSDGPLEGIVALFSLLGPGESSSLAAQHFVGESARIPLYLAWTLLVFASVILCYIVFIMKSMHSATLASGDREIVAFLTAGVVILMIYSSLGLANLAYIMMGGLVGYSMLVQQVTGRHRRRKSSLALTFSIAGLFVITMLMNAFAVADDSYGGQSDVNGFAYFNEPASWYFNHAAGVPASADVLTAGYFAMQGRFEDVAESHNPRPFSTEDLEFVFFYDGNVLDVTIDNEVAHERLFIFNYKQQYFAIYGWEKFKSWSSQREEIHKNTKMNVVFSSGNIDICSTDSDY